MISYIYFFLKGFTAGFTIAAIGGPVSILCIRHTITEGLLVGIAIGFGAALADALFGSVAGFSITIVADFLVRHQKIISLFGGLFLFYLGSSTFFEKQQEKLGIQKKIGIFKGMLTSFFITLANPATILFFTAISVSLGAGLHIDTAIVLISGIFVGSITWFSALSFIITIFHTTITATKLALINKFFGLILIGLSIFVIGKSLFS